MSIIYEALKKVEQNKNFSQSKEFLKNLGQNNKAKQAVSQAQDKNGFLLPAIFFITLALLLTFIYMLNYRNNGAGLFPISRKAKPPIAKIKISPVLTKKPLMSPQEIQKTYILEGIVYDQKDPFAIINGRVLRNYDRIDDFMIVNITKETVQIANINDKSRTTLNLPF